MAKIPRIHRPLSEWVGTYWMNPVSFPGSLLRVEKISRNRVTFLQDWVASINPKSFQVPVFALNAYSAFGFLAEAGSLDWVAPQAVITNHTLRSRVRIYLEVTTLMHYGAMVRPWAQENTAVRGEWVVSWPDLLSYTALTEVQMGRVLRRNERRTAEYQASLEETGRQLADLRSHFGIPLPEPEEETKELDAPSVWDRLEHDE